MAKARRVKGITCNGSVTDNARRIITVRLAELYAFAPYVDDPANVTELHDLRIAAKRLRYTLELFRFAFSKDLDGLIDEVKEIQEHIGDMHDADVMIERVREILREEVTAHAARMLEMADAIDGGTIEGRLQHLHAAMTRRMTPQDEVACYTLIAHRADDRDTSYTRFIKHWRALEADDFPGRLRRCVGIDPPIEHSDT